MTVNLGHQIVMQSINQEEERNSARNKGTVERKTYEFQYSFFQRSRKGKAKHMEERCSCQMKPKSNFWLACKAV